MELIQTIVLLSHCSQRFVCINVFTSMLLSEPRAPGSGSAASGTGPGSFCILLRSNRHLAPFIVSHLLNRRHHRRVGLVVAGEDRCTRLAAGALLDQPAIDQGTEP